MSSKELFQNNFIVFTEKLVKHEDFLSFKIGVCEWRKNENFLKKEVLQYPVISCIFGEKNAKTAAKIFLGKPDERAQEYFKKECKRFGNVKLQFVDTRKKSEEMLQRKQNIKERKFQHQQLTQIQEIH